MLSPALQRTLNILALGLPSPRDKPSFCRMVGWSLLSRNTCAALGISHLRGCGDGAHPGVDVAGRCWEEPVQTRAAGQLQDPGAQG